MTVRAKPLVSIRRDLPSRLANAEREIGFVPLGGPEGLVEPAHTFEARAADDPRADDGVDLLNVEPVRRPDADRALQALPVGEILPGLDRVVARQAEEPAAETQKTDFGIRLERRDDLRHEPR